MESGFTSDTYEYSDSTWQRIPHQGSGRFEFFRVRLFGAMHFVKRPVPRYTHDLQTTESLRKEFNLGYNLSHPGLVKYLRMENGAVFQEYVDGLSLRQMIDQDDERLKSPQFIESVCRQLLEASEYLHSHGVVHNDIKPENVMITRIGDNVKLVDLGCASSDMWDATDGYTEEYKAPEQGTDNTNVYTDIYLVGQLMELLAPMAKVEGKWRRFISKATADEVKERFRSDREAIVAIPTKVSSSRKSLAAAGLILLVSVVGISLFMHRRDNSESIGYEAVDDSVRTVDDDVAHTALDADRRPHSLPDAMERQAANKDYQDTERSLSDQTESTYDDEAQKSLPDIQKGIVPDERNLSVAAPGTAPSLSGHLGERSVRKSGEFETSSATDKSSLLRQLTADMEKYIKNQYEKRLLPDFRKYAAMPLSYDKCRYDVSLNVTLKNVVDDVTGYVERLASEHPDAGNEILQKGYAIVEREQMKANAVKYPKGEEAESKEMFRILNRDSIYEIYYKQ